ncbi:tRNA(His) guanylyltransferase 1-like [Camellia sinensis]|uniref:tRNA(His) guanylyltransferase 1-like n=1 Tax=Camellia sinensis TaxID=4442 RepID=UPI00103655B4|nr:tRNA(His) guanylyltransferase 1-like [Camellia sinensis]
MNSCAVAVLEEFQDIVFSYGVSDEYSFVLKKDSQLCQRHARLRLEAIQVSSSRRTLTSTKSCFPMDCIFFIKELFASF